jgi:hypothetical protein
MQSGTHLRRSARPTEASLSPDGDGNPVELRGYISDDHAVTAVPVHQIRAVYAADTITVYQA